MAITDTLTIALCSFNRAARLPKLIEALRAQTCSIPFDILVVNNNSTDQTLSVLARLQKLTGPKLRVVTEKQQGIPFARNRALNECMDRTYMLFIDDDELPMPGFIEAGYQTLHRGADVVGGRVNVSFNHGRPSWLTNELLGFLAEVDYGDDAFRITSTQTPLWTANIGYRMQLFADHPDLRFDTRYNRAGNDVGGGEDAMLFRDMLASQALHIRYEPSMIVSHHVESWRLRRSYFLKLHYAAGVKHGKFQLDEAKQSLYGVPRYLFGQLVTHTLRTFSRMLRSQSFPLRQAMNVAYTLGLIQGCRGRQSGANANVT